MSGRSGERIAGYASGNRRNDYVYGREARIQRIQMKRRRKAIQRRIFMAVFLISAALLVWIVLTGFSGMSVVKAPVYKYYTAVTVRCNDTLWEIASEHISEEYSSMNSYLKEIRELNNMKSDAVYYGQKLVLPYYSTEMK